MNADDETAGPGWPSILVMTVLGLKVLFLLQLLVVYRCRRRSPRPAVTAIASVAVFICAVLLTTGHQAQRVRSAKTAEAEALLPRDRPAAVAPFGGRVAGA